MVSRIIIKFELILFALILCILFSGSSLIINDQISKIRLFTRAIEFDYFDWTLNAVGIKITQDSLSSPFYFNEIEQHRIVTDYLKVTDEITQLEYQLKLIYSDPAIKDPLASSQTKRDQLDALYDSQNSLAPFAEAVLELHTSEVLNSLGLTSMGMPIPPVLFHITPLPYNLIISPRDRIQQDDSVSLISDLPVNVQSALENEIDSALNISSLVVPVGGIGSYPTMIERSTSLNWISNTIAHEWIHNWLSIRPLGASYNLNNELRTMNETTASIAGDEIGGLLIKEFYPEMTFILEEIQFVNFQSGRPDPNNLPKVQFDFRYEMHLTRIEVDKMLAEGKIETAEKYMETRRKLFWDNGYAIRKLNQAYFAFFGAYSEVPGGAAGEDPVGPAVRALRAQSPDLRSFLVKISNMNSYDDLIASISQ